MYSEFVWEWEFLTVCVFIKIYCSFTDWLLKKSLVKAYRLLGTQTKI